VEKNMSTQNPLFGECLAKVVRLSAHDVSEILEHQAATRRKFGEIALAWGLCRPQHVWQAWWAQLATDTPCVDLHRIGVDVQAVAHLPADLAVQFRAVPLRCHEDQLVVATCERGLARAAAELPALIGKQVKFVVAEPSQLDEVIVAYYPSAFPTAGAA
jgi:hypothetical protein